MGGHDPVILDESFSPKPLFKDTWAISLVRRLIALVPIPGTDSGPKSEPAGGIDVPSEDISDGFISESAAESSDVNSGKSVKSVSKRKLKKK